jgi:hypothetical protein
LLKPTMNLLFGTRPWGPAMWIRYWRTLFPSRKPADLQAYAAHLRANLGEPGRLEALKAMLNRPDEDAVGDRLGAITAPTLVVMGTRDPDFSHVEGLADLRRQLQLRALREMAARCGRAAIGRAGDEAVLAAATAARDFAREHPGLYAASLGAPPAGDRELNEAAAQFIGIFFDAMRQYGFQRSDAVHAVRGLFSTVHGFIMLERAGTFAMPVDVDESFRWLIDRYIAALHLSSTRPLKNVRRGHTARTGVRQ